MDYKEKLRLAKEALDSGSYDKETIEYIFPELTESEDERIRKALISFLKSPFVNENITDEKVTPWIAWLEKQANHVNFCNKIQIGDKVTRNKDGVLVNLSQLNRVAKKDEKQGEHDMGISEATKQKLEVNLNKALEKETPESWNEFLDGQGEQKSAFEMKTPEESLGIDSDTYNKIVDECVYGEQNPAWSEDDEANLNEALSYIKDNALKEFIKSLKDRVQPKQEWSEEDARMLNFVVEYLERLDRPTGNSCINWLKSLKERVHLQPKQEWSKDDIDMIDWFIRCCEKEHEELCNDKYGHQDIVSDLKRDCRKKWNWLESLKNKVVPHNRWKPSDEQMDMLAKVCSTLHLTSGENEIMESIYDALKKLKE